MEKIDQEQVWVWLPRFPMQHWHLAKFETIGNHLGKFLEAHMSFEETWIMTVAKILVSFDLRKGLWGETKDRGT